MGNYTHKQSAGSQLPEKFRINEFSRVRGGTSSKSSYFSDYTAIFIWKEVAFIKGCFDALAPCLQSMSHMATKADILLNFLTADMLQKVR